MGRLARHLIEFLGDHLVAAVQAQWAAENPDEDPLSAPTYTFPFQVEPAAALNKKFPRVSVEVEQSRKVDLLPLRGDEQDEVDVRFAVCVDTSDHIARRLPGAPDADARASQYEAAGVHAKAIERALIDHQAALAAVGIQLLRIGPTTTTPPAADEKPTVTLQATLVA